MSESRYRGFFAIEITRWERNLFLVDCSSAITHKDSFFRLYLRDSSDHNRSLFVIAHNNYIRVLNEYNSLFAVRVSHNIASHKFSRRNYNRLCNNRILFDLIHLKTLLSVGLRIRLYQV